MKFESSVVLPIFSILKKIIFSLIVTDMTEYKNFILALEQIWNKFVLVYNSAIFTQRL